ncbi:MAG: YchJ family protein [Deltaproteobacteria bacterium]|nr:YchJ family protein [Deltaproteobacteria bacterium]MBW2219521.1 YchJ family protein [Deltaproteobacteria bacterium]
MERCPCDSGKEYKDCCEPFLTGVSSAQTAEALMRSRYTAFSKGEVDYILQSLHPDKREQHEEKTIRNWALKSEWIGLEIVEIDKGAPDDNEGKVEFIAKYRQKGRRESHHELAEFKKENGKWYFYDGQAVIPDQFIRSTPKVGRNDPCPCGSGKKYKKCCGK